MSNIWMDSWKHYTTLLQKYSNVVNGPSVGVTGRFGGNRMNASGNDNFVQKTLPTHATYIAGFAFKPGQIGSNGTQQGFVTFGEAGIRHVFLGINTGLLRVTRGDGTVLATSTRTLTAGLWYYIELKVLLSDTVGTVEVRVNGEVWASGTALDTRNGGAGSFTVVELGSIGNTNGGNFDFDDFYVNSGATATNNDFWGDTRIECVFPSGDGATSQWVGSDGNSVNNSLLVDENPPNSDTDYVESGTVGNKDTYAYGDLATATGTVFAVQVNAFARKTDAGSRSIVSVARLAATEVDSAVEALLDSYVYLSDIRETKPGGGAWAISDVNSAEFGVKVNA
jgi:hypothetical protein